MEEEMNRFDFFKEEKEERVEAPKAFLRFEVDCSTGLNLREKPNGRIIETVPYKTILSKRENVNDLDNEWVGVYTPSGKPAVAMRKFLLMVE